jgi:hypothetical protein
VVDEGPFMRKLICIILCVLGGAAMADDTLPASVAAFAAVTVPCEVENNVDTCWSRGLDQMDDDPAKAILHYEMSCAFPPNFAGCYDAAKLYLLDRSLRDLARANALFAIVCTRDGDIGFRPYACKYLGWMYLRGVGAPKDGARAQELLEQSCFTPQNNPFVDAEGCELLGQTLIATHDDSQVQRAFLAFAMGCLDGVSALCKTAGQIVHAASVRSDPWVPDCAGIPSPDVLSALTCTDLPRLATGAESTFESAANENRYLRDVIKQRVLSLDEDLNVQGEAN